MTPTRPPVVFTRVVPRRFDECRRAVAAAFPDAAVAGARDAIRFRVRLAVGPFGRTVPMRLEVAPWTTDGAVTGVELVPMARVRPSRRYLAAGHSLLDGLLAGCPGPSPVSSRAALPPRRRARRPRARPAG